MLWGPKSNKLGTTGRILKKNDKTMYRLVITAGILSIVYSSEDLADKRKMYFPNCFTIHAETLDKGQYYKLYLMRPTGQL